MSSKTKTMSVSTLWDVNYCSAKLLPYLYAALGLFILIGCKQDSKEYEVKGKQQQILHAIVSPDTIHIADLPDSLQPKPIFLENRPAPLNILVPKASSSNSPEFHPIFKKTPLKPPVEVEAEFSTVFQNYSTEEGVAVDLISCSFADSKGNLWFGTFVAGHGRFIGTKCTV